MKKLLVFLFATAVFIACNNEQEKDDVAPPPPPAPTVTAVDSTQHKD